MATEVTAARRRSATWKAISFIYNILGSTRPSTTLLKALVAKTSNVQNIQFEWHTVTNEEYEKKVQIMCHVEDQSATVSFFHSLLKKQGKLLIVHEAADSGWAFLWKTYRKTLWPESTSDYLSAGGIRAHLDRLGLRYDVVTAPNCFDITDRFNWDSTSGARLLDFMTVQDHFHQSLTPEVRKGILDLLRNKCSTEKKGRVML